jgi:DsbC/DsbD-like thiol-disulfide interchange protein/cytochrome c biogenesis protein CcdA
MLPWASLKNGGNSVKALMAGLPHKRKGRNGPGSSFLTQCHRLLVAVLLQALALLCAITPAQARPTNIAAELIAESPAPPGGSVTLAFRMTPGAGWHGYWQNPGDAGLGMELDWTLPSGAKAGAPVYPVPQTLLFAGLMNHIYKGEYAVLVPLTLPADAVPGSVLPVSVDAQWLACTDKICVPESATLQTQVTVGAAKPDPRFDAWRAKLPAPLGSEGAFALTDRAIRIGIPLPAAVQVEAPHFFAAEDKVVDYNAPQAFARKGDLLIVEIPRAEFSPIEPASLSGVLRLNAAGDGLFVSAAPGAVPQGGTPLATGSSAKIAALPVLLLGALLGGLLLNIMPCVFPILSLKALSLARAGGSEAEARQEGVAYTAGVVLACAGLGALLLALRAAGNEVGWAFQLQEPLVVAALLLLAVAITANFLGFYEFAVPGFATAGAPRNAFATGLLAAFAATPCTGPFMAAAMGAALLLPVAQAMALFIALGLGLALPFLAIAFIPALRRMLPRPGSWMVKFRHWMALPMGLTALALLWLASRLGGWGFALGCAGVAAALIILLVVAGRTQRQGKAVTGLVLPGVAVLGLVAFLVLPQTVAKPDASAESILPAQPFSETALAKARASGKPVFAWFTADWCLTCKVNEQVAIERTETRDAFVRGGVTVLRGDWTRRDPEITRYLTAHGAAGVPLYVWYPAGGGDPQVLPQVLTPGTLTALVGPKK